MVEVDEELSMRKWCQFTVDFLGGVWCILVMLCGHEELT